MTMLEGLEKEPMGYLSAYVSQETLDGIEAVRGRVPRSRVVQRALELFLELEKKSDKVNDE